MTKEDFLSFLKNSPQKNIDDLAFKSILKNELTFLSFLIENKFINNPKNRLGQSLLHYSIICDNVKAFDIVINNRFNVNEEDDEGRTPLHYATLTANYQTFIKTLFDYGALLNTINERHETPFFYAVLFEKYGATKLLKELGADVSIPNDIGQSPKYIAFKNNSKEIITLLYD